MDNTITSGDFDNHLNDCAHCRHNPLNPCSVGRNVLDVSVEYGRASRFDRELHDTLDDHED